MGEGSDAITTAIALGANLPGPAGSPRDTLVAVRPELEGLLQRLGLQRWQWSPLFRTAPVGGPAGQPFYLNAVLLGWGRPGPGPLALLLELQNLEARYGRQRLEPWGPRSLDLDLLWWGNARVQSAALHLPHPRLAERAFVLTPLAALAPALVPPGCRQPVATLLAGLQQGLAQGDLPQQELSQGGGGAPAAQRLPGEPDWPD